MCIMGKPFVFGVSVDSEHFIGRKEEVEKLVSHFHYGVNTILISPRRIGKTSLVKRVAETIDDKELKVVHMDAFSCRNEYDFLNMFASSILKQTASRMDEWRENAQQFLSRITPRISFSPEPLQDYSLSLGITPKTHTPEEVLNLPEQIASQKGCHIVVCIDEFQQVGDFPDSLTVQKRMRSVWQHQHNVSYCLSGSKKNMMTALFQGRSMPFYKFGTVMELGPILAAEWIPYLCSRFAGEGKSLPVDIAEQICHRVELYSSYVQQLAFNTLLRTKGTVTQNEDLAQAFEDLLDENTSLFIEKTERLTAYQLNFLKAVINGIHTDFGTASIREGYNLGSPSNIPRIKTALLERELIEMRPDGRLCLADPLMKVWLQKRFSWA